MAMADSPPESAFADLVVEFLDTATHQILYQRGIYPQRVFTRCSKFGVPVLRSEHPRVNQFIGDHLRSVHEMMESGSAVCRVDVAVLSNAKSDSNSSVEGTGKSLPPSEKEQQNRGGREDICESYAFRFHRPASFDVSHPSGLGVVESNFRTMLLKLNSALASLPKLDAQDPSFTFRIHSTAEDGAEMSEELRWAVTPASISAILKEDSETKSDADNSKALNSELVPVCAMKIPFGLEISISLFS